MKLFFASDLHGSLVATHKVIEQFEASNADWLILLGDILYHGPRNPLPEHYAPPKVAECLNQYATKIIAVQGNCDSEVDQMMLTFPLMARWQQVLLSDRRLFLTHGHHYNPNNLPALTAGDVFVYGHTHLPQAEKIAEIYCFNPGSASLPKGGYPASFGIKTGDTLQILTLNEAQVMIQINL